MISLSEAVLSCQALMVLGTMTLRGMVMVKHLKKTQNLYSITVMMTIRCANIEFAHNTFKNDGKSRC